MIARGSRVRVSISNRDRYANGAAESLDLKLGTVDAINDRVPPRQYLVRFDEPASRWWGSQTPPASWWFDASDLIVELTSGEPPEVTT